MNEPEGQMNLLGVLPSGQKLYYAPPNQFSDPGYKVWDEKAQRHLAAVVEVVDTSGDHHAKFEVFKGVGEAADVDAEWYWHLRAANGEVVAQSEGYGTLQHAEEAVAAVKRAVLHVLAVAGPAG
jgi:uncharacterized protein YegP (UPF0339 family)